MLKVEKCKLRPLREEDLRTVLEWRNSEQIRENMYTTHIISWEEHWAWFQKINDQSKKNHMVFTYENLPLGVINVSSIDEINNRCHWGFYIGEEAAPRGSGMAMGYLGLQYIFEELGIRKLYGEVLGFNEASIKYHKKLGFIQEGHFREHILRGKQYIDIYCFAILRSEWVQHKNDLKVDCFAEEDTYE